MEQNNAVAWVAVALIVIGAAFVALFGRVAYLAIEDEKIRWPFIGALLTGLAMAGLITAAVLL